MSDTRRSTTVSKLKNWEPAPPKPIETVKDLVELIIATCICGVRRKPIARVRGKKGGEISISRITKYISKDPELMKAYLLTCSDNYGNSDRCISNMFFIVRAQVYLLLRGNSAVSRALKLLALKGYLTQDEKEKICSAIIDEIIKK